MKIFIGQTSPPNLPDRSGHRGMSSHTENYQVRPWTGLDTLIHTGLDHLQSSSPSAVHSSPTLPRRPSAIHLCVMISIYRGILGSGDLVVATLSLDISVGASTVCTQEIASCHLVFITNSTSLSLPLASEGSVRRSPDGIRVIWRVCWESNGVDQGFFPVILGYNILVPCRSTAKGLRRQCQAHNLGRETFSGVLLQCSIA